MESALKDIRYAFRILLKSPGFSSIAIITLALGIAANTAIFSAINTLLLKSLPIRDVDRVLFGLSLREGFDPFGTSYLEFSTIRDRTQTLANIALATQRSFNINQRGTPERVAGAEVDAEYLPTLGISAELGRTFTAEDARPGGPAVAMIGYGLWNRSFGGTQHVIGQVLDLDGRSYTVVGVAPRGFDLPAATEIWIPIQSNIEGMSLVARAAHGNQLIARMRPGATIEQTNDDLKSIASHLAAEYPQIQKGWSYKTIPIRRLLLADFDGRVNKSMYALAGAVGFLLLICCANVANLLLARSVSREHEIGIRQALGAGRARLVRQLLTESFVLAIVGGVSGLLLSIWITPSLGSLSPIQPPSLAVFLSDFHIDSRAIVFSFGITLVTALVFGLVPALRGTRGVDLISAVKRNEQRSGKSAGSHRLLSALIIGEIAIAITLLAGGALLVRSFERLQRVELGFHRENLLTMQTELSPQRYPNHQKRIEFVERVMQRVQALPGVVAAGVTTNAPLDRDISFDSIFTVEGHPPANSADVPITAHRLVTPGYLSTIGVQLLAGRLLEERDRAESEPVAVISEEFARQGWPAGENPLGKRIKRGRLDQTNFPWMTVVGVVRNVKEDLTNFRIDRPVWYLPYEQHDNTLSLNLVIKSDRDPTLLSAAVSDVVREVDPSQPVSNINTMDSRIARVLSTERFSAILMGTLSLLGLLLAAVGLYGVMSYAVNQRAGEFGLRSALGARPSDVFKLVMRQGVTLVVSGIIVGIAGALTVTRFLSSMLYEVSARDPVTLLIITSVLAVSALAACLVPARRATRVDPMITMRQG